MARARRLEENYLLFGAYPQERAHEVEAGLRDTTESHRGRILSAAQAHRVWGERFFPVAPSHPTPGPVAREIVSVAELPEALRRKSFRSERTALQGTVARSAEVLLLAIGDPEEVDALTGQLSTTGTPAASSRSRGLAGASAWGLAASKEQPG